MLNGTISYLGRKYRAYGYDTAGDLKLKLSSSIYEDILFMIDAGCENEDGSDLFSRGISVSTGSISVETGNYIDEITNKTIKYPINKEFFCKLGAILRYIKMHCYTQYSDGYTGLQLASGEFQSEDYVRYNVPFEKSGDILANVTLYLGTMVSLHCKTDWWEIHLEDDKSMDGEVYPTFKNGVKVGFAFNADYLGFELKQQRLEQHIGGTYKDIYEVIEAHHEKEFSWLLGNNYIIVTDDTLEEICDYIYNYTDDFVYYDTETTGLNITFKSRVGQADQCVGIVLSVKAGESFFFPMQMKTIKNLCDGDHAYFMEHYMRRILEGRELVAHNMSFDWKVAYIYDINANIKHDTMALFKLTMGNQHEDMSMKLKDLAKVLLHRDSLELSDLVVGDSWGENDIRFWDLPEELVRLYACADTDNTRGLYHYAMNNNLLSRYNAYKVYEIEIAFSYGVAYQEFYGHLFDVRHVTKLREEIGVRMNNLYKQLTDIVGHEFNPNSSPQLLKIMYQELGIPMQISRKTNRPTTDKDTLKHLASLTNLDGEPMYPFCVLLLEYRQEEGVRKIIDKFPELATKDGYLFPGVQQYGTRTGRVSIKEPNYQSYNDPVKKNIIPRPGYYMFDTDYSSVEYRVLGNMSGNKRIKESFYDPDFDYHTYQAARMYGVPYSSVTSSIRKAAKSINFGLPYGMGDESLGVSIFGEKSEENTRKASALRRSYFKGQEDIQDFFENARSGGVQNGFTSTYFGRRRYYNPKKFSIGSIRRQAGNQVIQGCIDGNTRIQTKEYGIVKIKDVVNQHLDVWDGEYWSEGDILYSGKKQKCIVKFNGGMTMVCSPIHKFLVVSAKGNMRFVDCQDLKPRDKFRNPHRVVINKEYEPSDYRYSSSDAYKHHKFMSKNNAYLEDIESSFDIGVVLGRLASDGTYLVRDDGGSYITQLVAEHEYSILPELRSCMQALGFVEREKDRDTRNQKMKELTVYSKSLANEVTDLDIKHQVHDNIFMDTELLRGFLSGFYDGDGGISGKTITLTFGVHYDFEPMCRDLQKALLFFGIRSRYRKYEDRHVLAIKTNDNQRFLDVIGFLNPEKQEKGRTLKCVEDERTFGRCLVVESVEITDEYIDMYDVCNTDGGYYVADGVITHNTAADIYKIAVGRVFKRICAEGWLGKVILTGFIHDELLGEVSCEIDPMKWLKVLREEFEVKISDENGEPWCPLYMGFGWGRNWKEAKSTEIPIKLQWEFVEKYGDTGYPYWDGDVDKFCDSVPDKLRDFEIRDCANQLLDENNQGKEIKPALNSAILGVLSADSKDYSKYLENPDLSDVLHITGYLKDSDGNIMESIPKTMDTQVAIDYFCMLHSIDRSKVNIESIKEVSNETPTNNGGGIIGDFEDDYEDEMAMNEAFKREQMVTHLKNFGVHTDTDNNIVRCFVVKDQKYKDFLLKQIKTYTEPKTDDSVGYTLKLYEIKEDNKHIEYDTPFIIPSRNINGLTNLYLQTLIQMKNNMATVY